jgi:hypothetical protein
MRFFTQRTNQCTGLDTLDKSGVFDPTKGQGNPNESDGYNHHHYQMLLLLFRHCCYFVVVVVWTTPRVVPARMPIDKCRTTTNDY